MTMTSRRVTAASVVMVLAMAMRMAVGAAAAGAVAWNYAADSVAAMMTAPVMVNWGMMMMMMAMPATTFRSG